jgi:hypothetical protein
MSIDIRFLSYHLLPIDFVERNGMEEDEMRWALRLSKLSKHSVIMKKVPRRVLRYLVV